MVLKSLQVFLASAGIRVNDACHNTIELVNMKTNEKILLVAESDYGVAAGIPGIYVEELSYVAETAHIAD